MKQKNFIQHTKHTFGRKTLMSHRTTFLLHTLPIQLIYQILDNLEENDIFMSFYGVCQRLNDIIDTYKPYQVTFHFIFLTALLSTLFFQSI